MMSKESNAIESANRYLSILSRETCGDTLYDATLQLLRELHRDFYFDPEQTSNPALCRALLRLGKDDDTD